MIQNEREYRITRSQAEKFSRALEESDSYGGADPLLAELHRSALNSQLGELREEMAEYEALKSGLVQDIEIDSLDALPRALIRARIASGMSQKQLAERLGLKEQQVQRYETSAYAGASLTRLRDISGALGLTLSGALHLPRRGGG
ncbi:MAG: helix-turn-helix domain-containing protein [Candidatus Hydrogenedentes bacterium]|jgi:DNA-binding XRE family transcriptional regulator|nr:helix-turn-helix domain-containing protein [Candidatus Hydrogenedentota bacterium]